MVSNSTSIASAWTTSAPVTAVDAPRGDRRRRRHAGQRDEEQPDALGLGLREAGHGGDDTTTASAIAASLRAHHERSAAAAIGRPSMTPHATGEPMTQNAYGRHRSHAVAVDVLGGPQRADRVVAVGGGERAVDDEAGGRARAPRGRPRPADRAGARRGRWPTPRPRAAPTRGGWRRERHRAGRPHGAPLRPRAARPRPGRRWRRRRRTTSPRRAASPASTRRERRPRGRRGQCPASGRARRSAGAVSAAAADAQRGSARRRS